MMSKITVNVGFSELEVEAVGFGSSEGLWSLTLYWPHSVTPIPDHLYNRRDAEREFIASVDYEMMRLDRRDNV